MGKEKAPAGGSLPHRGRWQGEALTDEGGDLTGETGRSKCTARLSNLRDDEGIVPYANGKILPCNRVRPDILRGPLHTRRCGGTLSMQERAGAALFGRRKKQRRYIMKILIIEDEKLLADSLKVLLEKKGFTVECVYDGETGEEYAETGVYDLLILDVMMPKMNGYQVARSVRSKRCATPILMLTARSGVEDRIEGLNAGADYYLTKPFDTRELLACVGALLRRQGNQVDELSLGNTALELATCNLVCGEKKVRLSAKEFDVMRFLLRSRGAILSKEVILAKVWGYDSNAVENNVEVYVGFLRKKLTSIGSNVLINSVRRMGYQLEVKEGC